MKYYSRIGEREYEVEIVDGRVLVDGEPVELDLRQSGGAELYSLLYNGRSFELLIEVDRFSYGVTLRGERFEVQVEDERTRRLNVGRKMVTVPTGEFPITAPIPGLVVKVLVEVGESVSEEQPLVILEAMKMENEIRAPRSGIVKQIEVAAGRRVEQKGLLLVLE